MSGTTPPAAPVLVPNLSPVPTAAASTGFVGALVVLVTYALSLAHITAPDAVVAALMVILTPIVHQAAVKMGLDPSTPQTPPAPAVTP